MKTFCEGWYVLYTKPRHEKKVYTRLKETNVDCFLPIRKAIKNLNGRRRCIEEPLFPSYLFIYLDNFQSYYLGIDTVGALGYVRTGKEIAKVNVSIVDNIKLMAKAAADLDVSEMQFQAGQQLVISEGPLAGLSCEVVRHEQKQKLLVRVELLNRSLLLTLPANDMIVTRSVSSR
jgi:transcriptional antiterminator RfaH